MEILEVKSMLKLVQDHEYKQVYTSEDPKVYADLLRKKEDDREKERKRNKTLNTKRVKE